MENRGNEKRRVQARGDAWNRCECAFVMPSGSDHGPMIHLLLFNRKIVWSNIGELAKSKQRDKASLTSRREDVQVYIVPARDLCYSKGILYRTTYRHKRNTYRDTI